MTGTYTVNSFFAGIGGFDLGFEKAEYTVKFQCEINDFCCQILRSHWPTAKLVNDIKNCQANDIPDSKVWCGGFPCQDVSVARGSNGREGLKGKNSGLFFDFARLIDEKKPKVVLIENVTGLLNSHKGKDFNIIIDTLSKMGYGVAWRVLNSKYFGVPQSRPRVYICAWYQNIAKAVYSLYEFEDSENQKNDRIDFITPEIDATTGIKVPKIAYCLAASSGRHTGTDWSRTYVSYYDRVRRMTPNEAERLQGFPTNWTAPFDGPEDKILDLDTLRFHAIGNAVSVPVVEWIAKRIKSAFDIKLKNNISEITKKFIPFSDKNLKTNSLSELAGREYKWLNGGICIGEEFITAKVSNCPTEKLQSNLLSIIDKQYIHDKYFISPSAARGILRRVDNQNRQLFAPLRDTLERMANFSPVSIMK